MSPRQQQSVGVSGQPVGVTLLWFCLLLFVLCGTLLSTAAGIPRFAEGSRQVAGDGVGLGTTQQSTDSISFGAFKVRDSDSQLQLEASIAWDCTFNLEGFEETPFNRLSSSQSCPRFNAFRVLLVLAIVLDFVTALALYTALLQGCLSPSASQATSPWHHWTLVAVAVVALAANVAAFGLMTNAVYNGFSIDVQFGVSWRLMTAAWPICLVATLILALDCHVFHTKLKQLPTSAETTRREKEQPAVVAVELSTMATDAPSAVSVV